MKMHIEEKMTTAAPKEYESVDVIVSDSVTAYTVDIPTIQSLASEICAQLGLSGWELSINFVDSEEIAYLNKTYRAKDKATDVLSFPQQEWQEPICVGIASSEIAKCFTKLLGDIVLSLEEAGKNAQQIGQGLDREVCFLIVHGILHLCGHDHMEVQEEAIMLEQQKKIMSFLSDLENKPYWKDCVRTNANYQE